MTRAQRLKKLTREFEYGRQKNCKKCGGTGWIKPGHRYGGCLCRMRIVRFIRERDMAFLLKLANGYLAERVGRRIQRMEGA